MSDLIFDIEKLGKDCCEFQGQSHELRGHATELYKKNETDQEFSIRLRVDGLMVKLANNMSAKIKSEYENENTSYQLALLSSFVRTHFIINDHILNSDLVEASILTRKQLESLTRLHELDTKIVDKLTGKTPNVQNVLKGPGKQLYPHLSSIAHFADPVSYTHLTLPTIYSV